MSARCPEQAYHTMAALLIAILIACAVLPTTLAHAAGSTYHMNIRLNRE